MAEVMIVGNMKWVYLSYFHRKKPLWQTNNVLAYKILEIIRKKFKSMILNIMIVDVPQGSVLTKISHLDECHSVLTCRFLQSYFCRKR